MAGEELQELSTGRRFDWPGLQSRRESTDEPRR